MHRISRAFLAVAVGVFPVVACGGGGGGAELIRVDGSSTVYPITEAIAQAYARTRSNVTVQALFTGTTRGFERFCKGETDIQDASRPIRSSEIDACAKAGVAFLEVPIAHDGITVIVHPSNDWAKWMTVAELKRLWEPDAAGTITTWKQIRSDWPDRPIHLYGPGDQSGTYDYFTEAIVGREDESRKDYTASEDDHVIVEGVAGDPEALGFVGFGYVGRNQERLRAVMVDDGDDEIGQGAIAPSPDSVRRGLYRPLARPLFIYVKQASYERPAVKAFVESFVRGSDALIESAGCIPLSGPESSLVQQRLAKGTTGSLFQKPEALTANLEMLLTASQ